MEIHQPSRNKNASLMLIKIGSIILLIDALLWAIVLSSEKFGIGNNSIISAIVTTATMGLFILGFPFIFIGALLIVLALLLRYIQAQKPGLLLTIGGLMTALVGVLAYFLPQLSVQPGSGDTLLAWMAGLTGLCVGIPLAVIGASVMLIGVIKMLRS